MKIYPAKPRKCPHTPLSPLLHSTSYNNTRLPPPVPLPPPPPFPTTKLTPPKSLAYEIAPFNINLTILQTPLETTLLTSKITLAPALPAYTPAQNPAPMVRTLVTSLLSRLPSSSTTSSSTSSSFPPTSSSKSLPSSASTYSSVSAAAAPPSSQDKESKTRSIFPPLPPSTRSALLSETIHAITAIGAHENPPARHIVGHEAVLSVKEKLKTVSEELEDFVDVSARVDIDEDEDGEEGGRGE